MVTNTWMNSPKPECCQQLIANEGTTTLWFIKDTAV